MTEHFGDWVPTVVRGGFIGDEIARADRHIISSLGPDGAWTLCGKWIPLGRLRVLSRNPAARTVKLRAELQHVEAWPFTDCHSRCSERHLYEKQHYRIGSGAWGWLWCAPSPVQPTATGEVSHGGPEGRLKPGVGALRLAWWRRWFRKAA